jgi:uncharacterized membrane protein HdeD (DUF308 family)
VVLGFGTILVPPIVGPAATIFRGWLFLIGGIVSLVATFPAQGASGVLVIGALGGRRAARRGAVLLWNPLQGLVTLTYVLISYFVVDGAFMIALGVTRAFSRRSGAGSRAAASSPMK